MPVLEAMRRWQLSKIAPEAVQRGKHCAVLRQNEPSVSNDDNRWCSLPDHIVELIVWELRQLVLQEQADPKGLLPICGVCTSWRNIARNVLFRNPWSTYRIICDPSQLFTLTPWPHGGGLLKCFVRREHVNRGLGSLTGKLYRFTLWQGVGVKDKSARFMMCAVQRSKTIMTVHLDRAGRGTPIALLLCNFMRTCYCFEPAPGCAWLQRVLEAGGYRPAAEGEQECNLESEEHESVSGSSSAVSPAASGVLPAQAAGAAAAAGKECAAEAEDGAAGAAEAGGTAAAAGPQRMSSLAGVRYKIRVRGMMMPRRMFIDLPCPEHLHSHPTYPEVPPHMLASADPLDLHQQDYPGNEPNPADDVQQDADADEDDDADQESESDADDGIDEIDDEDEVVGVQGEEEEQGGGWHAPLGQHAQQHWQAGLATGQSGSMSRASTATPDSMLSSSSSSWGHQPHMRLQNKPPHWNEGLRCWCLNFKGRVKLASVKNFQLMSSADITGRIIMQFGKVERHAFVLDFNPCILSMGQAFAMALTSFETKLLL